ncbi:MAG: hypothetical protein ABJ239_04880 [Erythrobacter sp.]
MMIRLLTSATIAAGTTALAAAILVAPASAQDGAGDKVNMVIVYGDDDCPQPDGDEITVCARKAEGERYRIPSNLRTSNSTENTAWTRRVESYEMVGKFGTESCSPAGAGGFTGCAQQFIDTAFDERAEGSDVRFGQLIEAARAERLSTIDADAAAEQARVEEIEREYLERLERERQAPIPGEWEEAGPPALLDSATADSEGDSGETPTEVDAPN